jgi:hypothetical protein
MSEYGGSSKPMVHDAFEEAVGLMVATSQRIGVSIPEEVVHAAARELTNRHRSIEMSLTAEIDESILGYNALVATFDATRMDWHQALTQTHSAITEPILRVERHPFGRGIPLMVDGQRVASLFGIPTYQGKELSEGNNLWLKHQRQLARELYATRRIPMTLPMYVFEQAQRREAGVEPLDHHTEDYAPVTRFPQYYIVHDSLETAPFACVKNGGLVVDVSDTRPYGRAPVLSVLGLRESLGG